MGEEREKRTDRNELSERTCFVGHINCLGCKRHSYWASLSALSPRVLFLGKRVNQLVQLDCSLCSSDACYN